MPFDGTPTKLAPTLENLAKLLRDKSLWPEGFEFDFWCCETCGMGLAEKYWGWETLPHPNSYSISQKFGMDHEDAQKLFIFRNHRYVEITPERLASEIETYLANKTRS